jgi:hypothetical protein
VEGEAGAPVAVASSPGRGRPPQAAARRAGLEFVEKLLTVKLTSPDTAERNAGMLCVPHRASLVAYWLELLVALAVVAVAQRRSTASISRPRGLPVADDKADESGGSDQ